MKSATRWWRWATLAGLAILAAAVSVGCEEDGEECWEQTGALAQVTSDTVTTDHLHGALSPDGATLLFSTDFWAGEDYDDDTNRDFAIIDVPVPGDPPRTPLARLFDAHNAKRIRIPDVSSEDGQVFDPNERSVAECDWNPVAADEIAVVLQNNNFFDRIYRVRILFGTESAQRIESEVIELIDDVDLPAAAAANNNQYYYRSPVYSPNGEWLAYSRSFFKRGTDDGLIPDVIERPAIFAINLNDGRVVRVTAGATFETEPTWSPDGNHIAFTSNRTGRVGMREVYRVRFDPDNPAVAGQPDGAQRLTFSNPDADPKIFAGSFDPTWMSNGRIIYVSDRRAPCSSLRDRNLWTMNGDGSDQRTLFFSRRDDHYPSAARSGGNTIVFSSAANPVAAFDGQKTDLYILRGF